MINETQLIDYVINQAVTNYFGEMAVFGLLLLFVFTATLIYNRVPFVTSVFLGLPIFLLMVGAGFFTGISWIGSAILVLVGLAYGIVVIKAFFS